MRSGRIRVLCVDDHRLVREGIALIINRQSDMEVIATAATGEEGIALYKSHQPDVVLMDLRLRTMTGLEAIRRIREIDAKAKIIAVTMRDGTEDVYQTLKAGVRAYLLKDAVPDELVEAVRAVHAGRRRVTAELEERSRERALESALTTRELQVVRLLFNGHSRKEMAMRLDITEETVHVHLRNIFDKFEVTNRVDAIKIAVRRGIVSLDEE